MNKVVIVREKKELEAAINSGAEHILIKGELAEKMEKARQVKKLSTPALAALSAAILATPFTGGISGAVGAAGIAALTGLEIVAIIAVVFLGVALVLQICDNFHLKFKAKNGDTEAEMEMDKK